MRIGQRFQTPAFGLPAFVLALAISAPAQPSYVFTKILDRSTMRPDGAGAFNISSVTTPAFDGQWVVFRDYGNKDDGSLQSIWSYSTVDGRLRKLVELNTRVPGGATTFKDFHLPDTAPSVRNGTVVFLAHESTSDTNPEGLYSVPAAGGAVARIANYTTTNPSGGTFTFFDTSGKQIGAFSFDGTNVAFNAQGSAQTLGNYSAKPDGSSLGVVADSLHPYLPPGGTVLAFSNPVISGSNVVMLGTDGANTSTGYHGLYLGRADGAGTVTELLNSRQPLPGAPSTGFRTRFNAPVIALDGTLAAFRAEDLSTAGNPPASQVFGLYWTDLTSKAINRIADAASTLPGLGRLRAIADGGVALNQGAVLFRAADDTPGYPGNKGLYLWRNGSAARVIGTGDRLDGQPVQGLSDPGPAALFGSSFAFNVEFGPTASGLALYFAKAAPAGAPSLTAATNAASYGTSSIAPGEVVTLFGVGMGPSTLAYFTLDANNRIPTSLAGVRILFNGNPAPLIYASDKQSAAIVPFEVENQPTAEIRVEYNGTTSAPVSVPVTNTMPGIFSADSGGSGLGAIQNADGSYNGPGNPAPPGSIVVLYVAGLGQLNPPQPNGSIVAGANLPMLSYLASVTIGGQPAQIVYSGPAPLAVAGLYQVNCVVPAGLASGPAPVVVTADGRSSQPNLTVSIR